MNRRVAIVLLIHAFVGWLLCAATMAIGMATTSLGNTLIIHASGAPLFFAGLSSVYSIRFNYTRPFTTALCFVSFVITVDFFVVALLINKSLEMFYSLIGTWIPFALIFGSTYITGLVVSRKRQSGERGIRG